MRRAEPVRRLPRNLALGTLAGLVGGALCWALGVGGRGPESGMWLLLMPPLGLVQALAAALLVRIVPASLRGALRLSLIAGGVAALSWALACLLRGSVAPPGVETLQGAVVGVLVGWRAGAPAAFGSAHRGSRRLSG